MSWNHKHLLSISPLSREDFDSVIHLAQQAEKGALVGMLSNKVIASCFFEPSTRTRLSFETAIHRLGGHIIGFADGANTSSKKGETLEDTIQMLNAYADAIVMRHPQSGSAEIAAKVADVPVINAGDGANQHPTQTLLDLYTIQQKFTHGIDGLSFAIVGDLKYGRTVHSLCEALTRYRNITIYAVAEQAFQLPEHLQLLLREKGVLLHVVEDLQAVIPLVDVIYMTRLQRERFENIEIKHYPHLNAQMLTPAKPEMIVLHPLPRVDELCASVDRTPHAWYFTQAKNGVFVRQAILTLLLSKG